MTEELYNSSECNIALMVSMVSPCLIQPSRPKEINKKKITRSRPNGSQSWATAQDLDRHENCSPDVVWILSPIHIAALCFTLFYLKTMLCFLHYKSVLFYCHTKKCKQSSMKVYTQYDWLILTWICITWFLELPIEMLVFLKPRADWMIAPHAMLLDNFCSEGSFSYSLDNFHLKGSIVNLHHMRQTHTNWTVALIPQFRLQDETEKRNHFDSTGMA